MGTGIFLSSLSKVMRFFFTQVLRNVLVWQVVKHSSVLRAIFWNPLCSFPAYFLYDPVVFSLKLFYFFWSYSCIFGFDVYLWPRVIRLALWIWAYIFPGVLPCLYLLQNLPSSASSGPLCCLEPNIWVSNPKCGMKRGENRT